MSDNVKRLLLVVYVAGLAVAGLYAKQERDPLYPQTRTWQAVQLPPAPWVDGTRIDVVDMAGVCLYVTRVYGSAAALQTVVVPKTQLPKGTGCQ